MKKVAKVSELKASLSKYLARVKAGEEVIVTERGKPVAKLVPILRDDDVEIDAFPLAAALESASGDPMGLGFVTLD